MGFRYYRGIRPLAGPRIGPIEVRCFDLDRYARRLADLR
jgi:hypothetical protein